MNQILDYIEVMFKSLPQTKEVEELKLNISDSMEMKYKQYIEEGKKETEAIGLVIGEFGSIDELKEALEINDDYQDVAYLPQKRVESFMVFIEQFGLMISIGVGTIMIGLGAADYFDNLIFFFAAVLIGVVIFVYYGMVYATYEDVTQKGIIDPKQYQVLKNRKNQYQKPYIIMIVSGVALCILAVSVAFYLEEFRGNEQFTPVVFMCITAIAVMMFINAGVKYSHITSLIERYEFFEKTKDVTMSQDALKRKEKIESLTGVMMGIAAMIYLVLGFTMNLWHPGWIIFPITALMGELISTFKN